MKATVVKNNNSTKATLSGAYICSYMCIEFDLETVDIDVEVATQSVTCLKMLLLICGNLVVLLPRGSIAWLAAIELWLVVLLLGRGVVHIAAADIISIDGYIYAGSCWRAVAVATAATSAGLVRCYHSWLHLGCHKRVLSLSVFVARCVSKRCDKFRNF